MRYLRSENSELKRRALFRDADVLGPLKSASAKPTAALTRDADQMLKSIALEAKVLIKVRDPLTAAQR